MLFEFPAPNNIHFPLTAVSNYNGNISREVRMTTIVQRDFGYPLLFRLAAGNINDMSTITRSINELSMHDIVTDFVLMDAGYFTDDNADPYVTQELSLLPDFLPGIEIFIALFWIVVIPHYSNSRT